MPPAPAPSAPTQERPIARGEPAQPVPEVASKTWLPAAMGYWAAAAGRLDRADPGTRAATILSLQRTVGNAAVQRLLTQTRTTVPVQRDCGCGGGCGGCGDKGQEEPGGQADLPVSRQVPPVYTPPACVLNGPTLVDKVIDGFKQGTPACLFEAWGLLNSRAMFDLLPALLELKNKGHWATVAADAAFRGGPRMELAVHAVNLKTQGSPIKTDQLRDLIDRLATTWADQRADILRFIGKYVVITVEGIDLDFSYVAGATSKSCVKEVQDTIAETKFMAKLYADCGKDKKHKTGDDIEACITSSAAKLGLTLEVAGSTSSTGVVTVKAVAVDKCQPIITRNTEIHESVHQHHTKQLEKKHGKGTPAFDAAWNEAQDWVRDERGARAAEIKFLTKVLAALKKLEKMVK